MLKLNDDLLACGGFYMVIKIWKLKSENPVRLLKGHTETVNCLLKLLKEELIASGGYDNTIRIWSLETDETLYILYEHSNNICKLINISENTIASCGDNGKIFIWNYKEKDTNLKIVKETFTIYCIELISEEINSMQLM